MRRLLCILLALCLLLPLCACGGKNAGGDAEPVGEMIPGYVTEEVQKPDWLSDTGNYQAMDTVGDRIYVADHDPEGRLLIACYDTAADSWQRYDLDSSAARHPNVDALSIAYHSAWALLREGVSWEDAQNGNIPQELGCYLLTLDLESGESRCVPILIEGNVGSEGSDPVFQSLLALDDGRALLTGFEHCYVVDRDANVLSHPELPGLGMGLLRFRVKETLYLWTQNGYAPFDASSLTLGAPISLRTDSPISSNAGHFLCSENRALCEYDPAAQRLTERFAWMDVALSVWEMGGRGSFENAAGDVYYPARCGFVKVSPGMVPQRKTLTLACFGESGADALGGTPGYSCTMELMDAIIRFNHTDPEYRVEIRPMLYAGEQERDRMLIQLATGSDLDLLDTSFLPDNALDGGVLTDLLPLIDADPELSREDFIQPLLAAMLRNGGLYEYTSRFTLLTMSTHPALFPGRENWTVDTIKSLIAAHPEMDPLWHSYDRELLLTLFAWAATAEFIDWESGVCRFDSPAFVHWLELLKMLPDGAQYSEEAKLLKVDYDYAFNAGFGERYELKDDYVITGFPEAEGTGSFYLKLGLSPSAMRRTMGSNTRVGILASGQNQDGAWRFVKTLMQNRQGSISDGISVLRDEFEREVDAAVTNTRDARFGIDNYNTDDAARLREQVYGTTKLVHADEELLQVIRSEAKAFFAGQKSAEEAARQIQSRLSIYVAEQG